MDPIAELIYEIKRLNQNLEYLRGNTYNIIDVATPEQQTQSRLRQMLDNLKRPGEDNGNI